MVFLFGSCNFLVGCHVFGECPPGDSSTVVHLKNQTESCDECPQVHIIVFYAPALGWSWWSIGNPWKPIARPFIQASSISVCTKRGWNSTWLIMGLNARQIDKSKMDWQRKTWKWTTSRDRFGRWFCLQIDIWYFSSLSSSFGESSHLKH